MNKAQLSTVRALADRVRASHAALAGTATLDLKSIVDDLQNSYDNHSDRWKSTVAAANAEVELNAVENLMDALAEIDDACKDALAALKDLVPGASA